MNLFFILASFFFLTATEPQLTTSVNWTEQSPMPATEVIYYSLGNLLTWEDFKGTPQDGRAAAITVSGFGYRANVNTKNTDNQLDIQVYCYFNKNKSWVKPGRTTDYILRHEQHHFDISYIAAKIFTKKLEKAAFTVNNYRELLPRLYNESCDIMNEMQDDYDGETKNGQLKETQFKWNELLEEKLTRFK